MHTGHTSTPCKFTSQRMDVILLILHHLLMSTGDRYDSHTDIMLMAIIVPAIATVGMLFVRSFWTMLWVVVIRSFFNCPLSAQIDSLTMSTIKDSSTYGTLRLWGAVSFGIFSFVGGALLTPAPVNVTSEASQWGFGFVFYGSALLTLVSGFVVLSIMFDKLSTTPAALAAGRQVQGAQSLELPELPVSSPQQEQQQGKRDPADRGVYTHVSTSEEESPGVEQRSLSGGNGITSYEKYARKGGIGGREERGGGGGSIGPAAVNGDTIAVWRHITILESLRNVLRQHPESSAFAVIVFLSGVGSGVIETFLFLHLKALGRVGPGDGAGALPHLCGRGAHVPTGRPPTAALRHLGAAGPHPASLRGALLLLRTVALRLGSAPVRAAARPDLRHHMVRVGDLREAHRSSALPLADADAAGRAALRPGGRRGLAAGRLGL